MVVGDQRLSEQLRAGTRWEPTLNRYTHTHTNTHSFRLGQLRHTIHLMHTSLGCGRKPDSQEITHTDMGRMCKLHTDNGLDQE